MPLLAHLSQQEAPKQFEVYSALAMMAYLLESIHPGDWSQRVKTLLESFPNIENIDAGSMGLGPGWLDEPLWNSQARAQPEVP